MKFAKATAIGFFVAGAVFFSHCRAAPDAEISAMGGKGAVALEAVDGPSAGKGRTAIDTVRPARHGVKRTDTVDGVVFSLAANKKLYKPGESITACYSITNRSMGTVLYDFPTSCQFDLKVTGSHGNVVYSRLATQPCGGGATRLKLPPSAEKLVEFAPVPLHVEGSDTLTIRAQMAGYPLSAVSLKVAYGVERAPAEPVALEGVGRDKPRLEFDKEAKMLIIRVERTRRLVISAFVLTGKKVDKLSCEKILAPGTHQINFDNKKLANGVVIFKVEGDGFSETKIINLEH